MLLRVLILSVWLSALSGAFETPSFIAQQLQDKNECRYTTAVESTISLLAGNYVFQQFQQSSHFDFVIKTQLPGCPDLPLVFKKSTGERFGATETSDAFTFRFKGEIHQQELLLSIPISTTCIFELHQSSISLHLSLDQICPVGEQLTIDFEPASRFGLSESDLMHDFNDFLDLMNSEAAVEIPKSLKGLLLIDGIRNYVRYDYKTKWESLSEDERPTQLRHSYKWIREAYLIIEPFITAGGLSQKAAVKAACVRLNSSIRNPKQFVDFEKVTVSAFNDKWRKFISRQLQLPSAPEELPKSLKGLLLIDGIRNYIRYDYETKYWGNLPVERDALHNSYRHIREVYIKIQRFTTGDLSQEDEVKAAVKAACVYLNSLIRNPTQFVDFEKVTVSAFNSKWIKFANRPSFPGMVIQSKGSRECRVSSTSTGVIAAGTYVLLQIEEPHSLRFDFQFKAKGTCVDLPLVSLRDNSMYVGTTASSESDIIRVSGEISNPMGKELILTISASTTCVYELVQASLDVDIPKMQTLNGFCKPGNQLLIEWEEPEILEKMALGMMRKTLRGISLVDGIWDFVRFDYRGKWKKLSKDGKKHVKNAFNVLQFVYNRLKRFKTGDLSIRSNVEATAAAACEELNSSISDRKRHVNFQKVSVSTFKNNWIKYLSSGY